MMNSKESVLRQTVGIIGGGRVGATLAVALHTAGVPLSGLVVRSASRRQFLAAILPPGLLFPHISFPFLTKTDILILAVPDDAIQAVADQLAPMQENWEKKYVVHLSGVHEASRLQALANKGAHVFSFHPILAISSEDPRYNQLEGGYVDIEGDPEGLRMARQMAQVLGMTPIEVTPQQKIALHAAAVMYSNFFVGLTHQLRSYFRELNLDPDLYFKPFVALIHSTIANLEKQTPKEALTGPLRRGDLQTIEKHLNGVQAEGSELLRDFYILMTRMLLEMVEEKLPPEKRERLLRMINRME